MKRSHRVALGIAASLGLGLGAAAAIAHPEQMMGGPMGMHGMGHGPMGGSPAAAQQLMTPEERQKLAEANRAEMEKRAKEKGITLPQPHGPRAGFGPQSMPPFAAPAR